MERTIKNHTFENPYVSVILPIYNGEKYLSKAIDSILAQTFASFELIMIDDGSSDKSHEILLDYQKLDRRIKVFSRENRGLATTLNESIDLSCGDWIARMDQDDIALPNRFERQLNWIAKTQADICGSWVRRFGASENRVLKLHQSDKAIKTEMLFCSPFAHGSVMMNSEKIKKLRYNAEFENAEDYDLWVRAAKASLTMTNVPEVLILYRVHSEQITSRSAKLVAQQEQSIRRRYFEFFFNRQNIDLAFLDQGLKIFQQPLDKVDMHAVNLFFTGLLRQCDNELKILVFNKITQQYIKLSAYNQGVISSWLGLNTEFSDGSGISVLFKIFLMQLFRIHPESRLFASLKKVYVMLKSL